MEREERLKISAIHEIGHYLLIKKIIKDFPQCIVIVYKIQLYTLKPKNQNNADIMFFANFGNIEDASNELLISLIDLDLAGFTAPTLYLDINYNLESLKKQSDYIDACSIANVLIKRYLENGIDISQSDILKNCYIETKQYLETKKDVLFEIAKEFYAKKILLPIDLIKIDKKYNL